MISHEQPPSPLARYRLAAVIFAMTYPTLLTWIYFSLLRDSPGIWQQAAFGIGKLIQFAFPAVWIFVIERRQFAWQRPTTRGLGLALAFGVIEIAAALTLYFVWLKPAGVFVGPTAEMLVKLRGFGIDSPLGYVALAIAYSLVHSWMEEYYWRWFVFNELRTKEESPSTMLRALAISGIAFAAHHVIVLAVYFQWDSPWTYIFSAFVAVGGAVYGWLYVRSESIYAPWLCHALADTVIFLVGYDLLATALT